MFNRFMLVLHWVVTIYVGLLIVAWVVFISRVGIEWAASNGEAWVSTGVAAFFYVIDYIIYGKFTWLPWQRDK